MKLNLSNLDRAMRMVIAVLLSSLCFSGIIFGKTALLILGLSGILVLTGIVGFCPLYRIFGISSLRRKARKQ